MKFMTGKQYLNTKTESMKQSDNPESTRALTVTGKEKNKSITYNAFKAMNNTELGYSADFLAS